MSPITVHILDTALGQPASGVLVQLSRFEQTHPTHFDAQAKLTQLATGHTNADGRLLDLLATGSLQRGFYQLRFDTASYFARTQRVGFYPSVSVVFEIRAEDEHYHVPLLLSPFGYSTYRGS
jgi:5-hydroxyisourate hydrolase